MTNDKFLDILMAPVLFIIDAKIRLERAARFVRASDEKREQMMAELLDSVGSKTMVPIRCGVCDRLMFVYVRNEHGPGVCKRREQCD